MGQLKVIINGGNHYTSRKKFRTFIVFRSPFQSTFILTTHHQLPSSSFLQLLYVQTVQIGPVQNMTDPAVYDQYLWVNQHVNEPGSPHWDPSVYALRHVLQTNDADSNEFVLLKKLHTLYKPLKTKRRPLYLKTQFVAQ
jgi:hypothetical protein